MTDRESRLTQKGTEAELAAPLKPGQTRISRILDVAERAAPGQASTARALATVAGQRRQLPGNVAIRKRAEAIGKASGLQDAPIGARRARFLGFPASKGLTMTRAQLSRKDIVVPTDKQITELQKREVALRKANNTMANIVGKVEGRPELLGLPKFVAQGITTISRGVQGMVNLLPDAAKRIPGFERLRSGLEGIAGDLMEVATTGGEVQSAVVDLTFQGGALAGQVGRGFSDKDFENVTKQVAAGMSNDRVMVGVMRSFALLQNEAYNLEFSTLTGTTKFVGMPENFNALKPFADLTREQLGGVIDELLSNDLLKKKIIEIESRISISQGQADE
tara:strand:- start:1590 stop:2594 length:1005 start_codon:yes stop_codon:yes gene_type:complete